MNSKSSVTDKKMVEYNKVNVKLSDTPLKKIKNTVEQRTGKSLRINLKQCNEIIYHINYYEQQEKK